MAQGILGSFGVRVPLSYLLSQFQPVSLFHIGLATPCSTLIQIVLCLGCWSLLKSITRTYSKRVCEEMIGSSCTAPFHV